MSNTDKYIDRNPDLQAAGKVFIAVENIGDSLKNYSVEEAASNIVNLKCKELHKDQQENQTLRYSQFLPKESLKDLLSPELQKSRFVAFKEKFSEDMFFKKPELGKATTLQSKPPEFTNENCTYGFKRETTETLYELVFPKKTQEEIEEDFMKWHDKYLISYKRYLPSEKIQRNYNDHFKPHNVYGISTEADKTGEKLKKCLQLCDRMVVINKTKKKFPAHKIGQPGEQIDRYNQTFGIQSRNQNSLNVKDLIENTEPCPKNTEITEALAHMNNIRLLLFNRCVININDLRTILKLSDKNGSGYVKLSSIMQLLRSLQIRVNEQKIRAVILHFQMFKDGDEVSELVSTETLWKLFHIQYPMPREIISTQFNKVCPNNPTTYRLLCADRDKVISVSQTIPSVLIGSDDVVTTGELIAPDVPMRYGLSSKDFKVLRPKEEINIIFKQLLPHNFDQVWQFACSKKVVANSCEMSVHEFKNYLEEYKQQLK